MRLPFGWLAALALAGACSSDSGSPAPEPRVASVRFELAPQPPAAATPPSMALAPSWSSLFGGDLSRELPLQFGLEGRPTRLLQPGWKLTGTARAPAAGARIALECGVLESRGAPGAASLEVRVRLESGAEFARVLELDLDPRWQATTIPLEVAAGEAVELTLSLSIPGGGYVLAGIPTPRLAVPEREPRTVLLVTSDTHRADHVEGVPGAVAIETPALRELGMRGVTFTNCWSTTNITVPSHVAILSGLHPRDTGVTDNQTAFAESPTVLAEAFRDAGWHTFSVTSLNLLAPARSGLGQGFERTIATNTQRPAQKAVDAALRLLGEAQDRSVFAWIHVFDAHGPYEPPAPWDTRFYPAGRDPRSSEIEPEPGMRVPPYLPGVRDAEYVRALYRGEVAHQDSELARLFAHPRVRAGVVAFTGDHGEVLGRHGIWWAHKDVYPDTLHVPLVLAWPGAPSGARVELPVEHLDLGRTLLDLAGFTGVAFPGRSLAQAERIDAREPRFALSGARTSASVTVDGWHLILQLADPASAEQETRRELHGHELFELASDPHCERDLASSERARATELRRRLVEWLGGWRGERLAAFKLQDADTLANLAALGYASSTTSTASEAPLIDPRCACRWCAESR